uniref:Ribonuclease H-like domain-containing protein n=1 Tax=Tanacetum cinerariifolium TaxID=118510 RepID=A0A6L2NRF3_TANCI|nr:ribonuclease H-like domain-containing protein [Tanacetum cinerariifolium]
MSLHGYTHDEFENSIHSDIKNVTLISKLDGKNKTGFIDGTCRRSAYATLSSEESYRIVTSGSSFGTSQRPSNMARPYDNEIRRNAGGPTLVCKKCGFNGHTIDRCFKIIGYLIDFGEKKVGQNFKGKNVSNNNFVGSSSSSAFSDEQIDTFISLIKDNSVNEKGVHANMVDLTSLSLIENLKVYEMIIKKDSKIVKAIGERKSLALIAKKESSDKESLTSGSKDEEYAMAVRDFKKFFKRRGNVLDAKTRIILSDNVRNHRETKTKKLSSEVLGAIAMKEMMKKAKDETCLMDHASSDVQIKSSYFSDENSSIYDIILDSEYIKLCK